ncbi:carbonyl reductase [Schizothecium vesticola]|uniref:Carbonyl reductase n=1 Tax=Schizothecium vesticola TaxID=314040 RepID=A0AA40ENQ5_9PEZI|nr:carbonyl reductase [Schizothecium vesticola]
MSYARVGVVTGANKGIGYAIVRQLALQYPNSKLNNGPLLIYLAARDPSRGETAVSTLTTQDVPLQQANALRSLGGLTDIKFHQLDISQPPSIQSFAELLRAEHPDGIDFVINNAGMAMDGFDLNVVKTTLGCNYHGTLAATRAFLPLLKAEGGRIVNVASMSGYLNKYSAAIRDRFLNAKSVDNITKLMDEFTSAVERGREKEEGWPSAAYATSKAGEIGMTLQIAAEVKWEGKNGVLVNACCPGWVVTDMTKGMGHKTPDQGAQTPVMLAIGDIGEKSGGFWQNEKEISWTGH